MTPGSKLNWMFKSLRVTLCWSNRVSFATRVTATDSVNKPPQGNTDFGYSEWLCWGYKTCLHRVPRVTIDVML